VGAPLGFFHNAQITTVRILAIAGISTVCLFFVTGLAFYGGDMHVATPILVSLGVTLCGGFAIWHLPKKFSPWKASLVLFALTGLCFSTLISAWASKGYVTYGRHGFTLIAACPVPGFDFRVSAGGVPWFRNKSHDITIEELKAAAEGADVVIIATGYDGQAKAPAVEMQIPVEVLKTSEAFARYRELRRAGKRVALIAHTTC